MFARIKDNEYDKNGNHLYRVYIYITSKYAEGQYKVIPKEGAKNLGFGRVNADNSITTQWTKEEIIKKLQEKVKISYNRETLLYVFE